ncbi:MAG: hypothetical protein HKN43_06590, partial [Rhodothermales bacterium]|nr:hypothetical protein [Rhodothermales bacterium]
MSKFLSRFVQDDLRREGLHLLGIVLGAVCIAFIQFFAWAILSETIQENPFGLTAILFFASQSILLLLFLYVALVGFSTEMRISITSEGVIVAVPGRSHTYTWGVIGEVSIIDADVYQKH